MQTKKNPAFCAMDYEIHSPPIYKWIINTGFHAMGMAPMEVVFMMDIRAGYFLPVFLPHGDGNESRDCVK